MGLSPLTKSRNFKRGSFFSIQLLLLATLLAVVQSDDATNTNPDDLGAIIKDTDVQQAESNTTSPSITTTEALSDAESRRRDELQQKVANKEIRTTIDSIYPKGGPTYGETRVLVRGGPFKDMNLLYPHPKCKFGRNDMIVEATYVACTQKPLLVGDIEGLHAVRNNTCLQCESSPPNAVAEIVSLMVSLTGDFTDTDDSENFRYYLPPMIHSIYPRYGKKDGGTLVEVWGENFLNFDIQTRCGFGTKTTQAHFISNTYMTCKAPQSDVVQKPIPFTISMNSQQNTREDISYWYYNQPVVSELQPNYGQDRGGNTILLKGSNFFPFNFAKDIDNSNDTFCYFQQEDIKMPMRVVNSTKAYCEVPPNVMHIDSTFVEVALNNRDWTDDSVPYFYYRPSKITNVDPAEGPTRGNTTVMVYGLNFTPGKKIICKFDEIKTRGKFISMSQIKCVSPPHPVPSIVDLAISYEGEDSRFQSETAPFQYYETPIITRIDPPCGPFTGQTQIVVKGRNFIDMGFGKVKCTFNHTFMNATIVNDQTIICDSPALTDDQQSIDTAYLQSFVQVTLNGREKTAEKILFSYYPELKITRVERNSGPVSGNTTSVLYGENFAHPNVCNLKVKYGAIDVQPKLVNDTLVVQSPQVGYPDAVTLFPSGNGQNFAPDYTIHYRDIENTFTYTQDVIALEIKPIFGPSTGGTKIVVRGYGFQQFKYDNGTTQNVIPQIRFVDQQGNVIGNASDALQMTGTQFVWYTPSSTSGTHAIMQISYNGEYWQPLTQPGQSTSFQYFTAPRVDSIVPRYGPVKQSQLALINGKNFECPDPTCKNLLIRFGSEQQGTVISGLLLSSSQIQVTVPAYTKPDVLPIEISFNGVDFTNSRLNYGYFDPFIIRVKPNLISSTTQSRLKIHGFGFISPDNLSDIKVKFTSPKGDLTCYAQTCIVPAYFIDKNTIECDSLLMASLSYSDGKPVAVGDDIWVELTLLGNVFTDNKVAINYFQDPQYKQGHPDSVPMNLNEPSLVETNFHWEVNNFEAFLKFSNFTCLFQVGDEKVITQGRLETVPYGSQYNTDQVNPTHVMCGTPDMHNHGMGVLKISANGQDYTGGDLQFEFSVALDLFRILPQCGPKDIPTKVRLIGSGFDSQKSQVFSKFGVISVSELQKEQVQQVAWDQMDWLNFQLMTDGDLRTFEHRDHRLANGEILKSIYVETPLPQLSNLGGPVYVSVGQKIKIDEIDLDGNNLTRNADNYYFSNSLVEYYYYKNPVVKKIEPTSGLTIGGTPIEVSGAWFDLKLQYGLVPHCKIGDKIIRGSFHSTTRIICVTPPNDNTVNQLPVKISLNGINWVESGFTFSYYQQSTINDIFPKSGQMNAGTEVYILGDHFSNITDLDKQKCRWTLIDNQNGIKRDKIVQYTPAAFMNVTMLMCVTPSSFIGGDRAFIQLTFNGKDYSAQDENLMFQFYQINGAFPHSGPANAQNEIILIKGAGFKSTSKIYCSLNKTEMAAIEITENLIKCPMTWPGKDPRATGSVKLGMSMDGSWTDFGSFFYYQQIELDYINPRFGPAEGSGLIYFYGSKFRDDFPNAELGCKIGESIGKAELIDQFTIRCSVEHIELVNEGDSQPVFVALNSYSWVAEASQNSRRLSSSIDHGYVPYGVQSYFPESGVMEGFTDIFITGKGFIQGSESAKCRFGVDGSYHTVDAEVLDYTKMVCRSPPANFNYASSTDYISVPFSISFGDPENKPWTQDLHRYRFYTQPFLGSATPDEINIRKKTEIYVQPYDGYSFIQPVPTGKIGTSDYHSTGGVTCSFEGFGTSMGMYVNQTTMLCLTPHIAGTSDDYTSETVTLAIAMNGQDFQEDTSYARVTFIGTGNGSSGIIKFVLTAFLIALLLLALFTMVAATLNFFKQKEKVNQSYTTRQLRNSDGNQVPRGFNTNNNFSNANSRQGFQSRQI